MPSSVLCAPTTRGSNSKRCSKEPSQRKVKRCSCRFRSLQCDRLCAHIVNTNSKVGTVQVSYLALSCPVKSHLPALPAPATLLNSFPFCTATLSTFNFQHSIPREFRFPLFKFP